MSTMPLTFDTDGLVASPQADELDAAFASLPMTYRRAATSEVAEVLAVGGPEWAARARSFAAGGARGILITDPWPLAATFLQGMAAVTCPVVIDTKWRHNPAVDLIGDGVARYRNPGALLEVRSTTTPGSDLVRAAVGLLDLVTAVAPELCELWTLRHDDRHLVLGGRLTDHTVVMLTIVATNAKPRCASLAISGTDGRAQLLLPDPITAASTTATLTDSTGHTALPVGNESAHRCAAKRLAAVVAGGMPPDDLARFVSYAQLLTGAVSGEAASSRTDQPGRCTGVS